MRNLYYIFFFTWITFSCSNFNKNHKYLFFNNKKNHIYKQSLLSSIIQGIVLSNLITQTSQATKETLIFSESLSDGTNISVFRFGDTFVIQDFDLIFQSQPSVTGLGLGRFLTSFTAVVPITSDVDLDNNGTGILGVEFDEFLNVTTPLFTINNLTSGNQFQSTVTNIDLNRTFNAVWNTNLKVASSSNFLDPDTRLGNQFVISGSQTSASFTFSKSIKNNIIFSSFSNVNDLSGIIFDLLGNIQKPLFTISDFSFVLFEDFSSISNLDNGNYAVTWSQEFSGTFKAIAQFFSSDDSKINNNLFLDSSAIPFGSFSPKLTGLVNNIYFIGWVRFKNSTFVDLVAQLHDSRGNKINTIFKINEQSVATFFSIMEPTVSELSETGISCWCWSSSNFKILCQMYFSNNTNLTKIGFNFRATTLNSSIAESLPSIANITNQKFSLCSQTQTIFNPNSRIACQLLRVEIRRPTLPPFGPSRGGGGQNPTGYILMITGIVHVLIIIIICGLRILCKKASVDADVDGNTVHFGLQDFDFK